MKDNKKHIDDLFKDQFNDFELPVDSADFAKIQAGLKEDKKNRFIIWWFILGAGLIAMTLFGVSRFDLIPNKNTAKQVAKEQKQGKVSESIPEHRIVEPQDGNAENNSNQSNTNTEDDLNEKESVTNPKNAQGESSNNRNFDQNNKRSEQEVNKDKEQKKLEQEDKKKQEEQIAKEKAELEKKQKELKEKIEKQKHELQEIQDSIQKQKEIADANYEAKKKEIQALIEKHKAEIKALNAKDSAMREQLRPRLKYSVGFNISPGLTAQKLSQSDGAHAAYSDYKESNELNQIHYDFGLIVKAAMNKWELSSGVNHTTYQFSVPRLRFQLKDSFPVYDPQGKIIDWIYKNYRDTTIQTGNKLTYRNIEIPLNLSRKIELNKKFDVYLQVGTQLSYMYSIKGTTVDKDLNIKDVTALPYNNLNFGWNSAIGLAYHIKPNWTLRVDGEFKNLSGNLYKWDYDAKAVLNNYGFKMSLMYELGKKN